MGRGIEQAREIAPEHAALIDDMKEQLLIALVRRLGGKVSLPCSEIDDTGGVVLTMRLDVDAKTFHFAVEPKQPGEGLPTTCLADGTAVTPDHRDLRPDGQQKGYVVLSPEERAKGFVRPVRQSYVHKACGVVTKMGLAIAETYARDPKFYSGTFCCHCREHFSLDQFVWDGTNEQVGS